MTRLVRIAFIHPHTAIHFAYQEMLQHPPAGTTFTNAGSFSKEYEARSVKEKKRLLQRLRGMVGKLPIPTYRRVGKEHAAADIVYASQVIPITHKPWVLDLEMPTSLTRFHQASFDSPINRMLLRKALCAENCRAVITWSDRAKKALISAVPEAASKIVVIPPTVAVRPRKAKKTNDLVFIGIDFERKGGVETLMAFKELRKRHPGLTLTIVSRIPEEHSGLARQAGVTVHEKLPREQVYALLASSRIFILPTFQDTYGLALVEAMAFGLPVITLEDYATAEIVEDGVTGYVLKGYKEQWFDNRGMIDRKHRDIYSVIDAHTPAERRRIVKDIVESCDRLLRDRKRYGEMSAQAKERVGRDLSPAERDRKLRRIFHR